MKILLVSTYFDKYGSGIAVKRIYDALLGENIDVEIISSEQLFPSLHNKLLKKVYSVLSNVLIKDSSKGVIVNISESITNKLIKIAKDKKVDVINLHWVCYLQIDINKLIDSGFRIVITHHDMWWMTGYCNYTHSCVGYIRGCTNCDLLQIKAIAKNDFQSKESIINNSNVQNVFVSNWLNDQFKYAKNKNVIGNVLPSNLENIYPKTSFSNPLRVLFIAANYLSDTRKGYTDFEKAIKILRKRGFNKNQMKVITIGDKGTSISDESWGLIHDNKLMYKIISNCDLVVLPSEQEAFGQTALEAASHGLPIISFSDTGIEDIFIDEKSGVSVKEKSIEFLADAIEKFSLLSENDYINYSKFSSDYVKSEFNSSVIARKYIEIYKKIINE
jgi:glycosyltransferase involved in cell wall biosynthesis